MFEEEKDTMLDESLEEQSVKEPTESYDAQEEVTDASFATEVAADISQEAEEPIPSAEELPVEDLFPERETAPVEEPIVEEAAVEEPIAEETAVEEPVAEEPVAAEQEPIAEPLVEEPVAEPIVEEPIVEPAMEEPVFETPVTSYAAETSAAEEPAPLAVEVPDAPVYQEPAPVVSPVPVTAPADPFVKSEAAPAAPVDEGAKPKKGKNYQEEQKTRTYTKTEKKLRRKYKMDKDNLFASNDVVPGFILARGEHVIRTYRCLASSKGLGTICLTDRRLLVNADERSEVTIEQITGIRFCKYANFYVVKLIFGLIFSALAILSLLLPFVNFGINIPNISGDDGPAMWAMILCLVGAAAGIGIALPFWITLVRKTFYFFVYANINTPFIACKNASFMKREAKGKVATCMVVSAGKESEKAARELGALIIEIKEGRFVE